MLACLENLFDTTRETISYVWPMKFVDRTSMFFARPVTVEFDMICLVEYLVSFEACSAWWHRKDDIDRLRQPCDG